MIADIVILKMKNIFPSVNFSAQSQCLWHQPFIMRCNIHHTTGANISPPHPFFLRSHIPTHTAWQELHLKKMRGAWEQLDSAGDFLMWIPPQCKAAFLWRNLKVKYRIFDHLQPYGPHGPKCCVYVCVPTISTRSNNAKPIEMAYSLWYRSNQKCRKWGVTPSCFPKNISKINPFGNRVITLRKSTLMEPLRWWSQWVVKLGLAKQMLSHCYREGLLSRSDEVKKDRHGWKPLTLGLTAGRQVTDGPLRLSADTDRIWIW